MTEEGRADWLEKGRKKLEEKKRNMTRKMLSKGMSVQDISALTGLPMEDVESLSKMGEEQKW